MTLRQQKSSARAYRFLLTLLGATLISALYVSLQVWEMTAQEVFGVEIDFDDV